MKRFKTLAIMAIALLAALISSTAWADHGYGHYRYHHGGARVGVYFGGPVLGFPVYPYPAYPAYAYGYGPYGYYGPVTTVIATPASPPTYIEQGSAATSGAGTGATGPASDGYWYYCNKPDGYYPYVKQCDAGWQKVAPQPGGH